MLPHNNKSQICYYSQISLQSFEVKYSFYKIFLKVN